MINAWRLFLVPSLCIFFLLIPVVGAAFMVIGWVIWYARNKDKIHQAFSGRLYDIGDIDDDVLDKMK